MTSPHNAWLALVVCVCCTTILGCGGNNSTNVAQQDSETEQSAEQESVQSNVGTPAVTPATSGGASLVHKKDGKTWIGEVPLDVWYDDPLAVASTTGQVAATTTPDPTPVKPEPSPMPEIKPAAPTGGIDWKRIIPGDVLDAEVTSIRNRFNADLQTVGSYNSSYLALPPHIVSLAVLSHIASKHPDDIRWKQNARYILQLAGEMGAEPLTRGAGAQKPLKEKADYIVEILSGSVPANLTETPADTPMADIAKVANIMKRLENASKIISVNGGTAEAMKENAAQIKQEAAVMGALTQVLLDGYEDYNDDEIFAGFVKDMVDASVSIREHVQNDQFDQFELDVSKVTQACQQCHSSYR